MVDLGFGKRFNLSQRVGLNLDLQLLNALNEDAWDYWETQLVQPGDHYHVDNSYYFLPRRIQVRIGIEF
jgi:hypothetical protein